jgi:hypothetical protein
MEWIAAAAAAHLLLAAISIAFILAAHARQHASNVAASSLNRNST